MDGLNGARVARREGTIFIALPRAAWREAGLCRCEICKGGMAYWDTLAVKQFPQHGKMEYAWTVHMPEIHGG